MQVINSIDLVMIKYIKKYFLLIFRGIRCELLKNLGIEIMYEIIFNRIHDNTQHTVDCIKKWANDNKMRLNIKKTKYMYINSKETEQDITLYGHKLERVDNYKYLGVIINNELNHDTHWDKVSKITNSQIYLLKQLKQLKFKEEILINVYRSLTLSHYTYSAPY
jgi:hypothetical protein